ncbi:MAG: thioredoxin domain-containing protein [Acidobacteria bacterium]|nr:thioredoxin domain-containing protein [Acidobacteriota bacterium]
MNNVNKSKSNSSSLPLVIIGLVLLGAIGGGYWLYQNSKAKPATAKKPSANANVKDEAAFLKLYQSAPAGASPANMLGSPNSQITIEEFADYQCPTCATTHPKMKEINSIYGNRIKFIFRNFPLSMHKHGYEASVAAEAAGLQGKFWDMQNQLFTNQQAWANAADARKIFDEYAQKIGLDVEKFQNDSLGLAAKQRVDADLQRARALNVNSTPTIYINGKEFPDQQFNVSTMRQVIDAELQKAQSGGGGAAAAAANQTQQTSNKATNVNQTSNSASGGGEVKKEATNSIEKK